MNFFGRMAWAGLAAAAVAGCGEDGVVAGAGEFGAELADCQLQIFMDAMEPLQMEFLADETWHTGDADELRIGGILSLPDEVQKPIHYEYECLMRNGRLINRGFE